MKWLRTKKVVALVIVLLLFLNLNNNGCLAIGEEEEEDQTEILAPMDREEKEALYSVVQGFVGNWWNGSDLYPDPCGWTPIQGVGCDLYNGLWYVTTLHIGPIQENSLSCTTNIQFKPQLFEFNHLKSLSFFNCFNSHHKQHQVSIPTTNWEKLSTTLESLEFRSNPGLIGPVPESLGSLVKLQSLVLIENGLSGQLPYSIGNLVNLERLVLSGNKLSGIVPHTLGGLNSLLIFDLSRNFLSGPLPLTFGGLTSLLKLDLSNNLLEGNLPSGVEKMKCLTLLDLSNNRFSDGLSSISIGGSSPLEQIVLSNNPIGGELKGIEFEKLERLSILELSNTGLRGEIPDSVMELKSLRFLGLSDNKLSGNLSPKLEALPSVGALYLNGNNLSGELGFSEWFYGKMGRRFGAWDNPNLCYPIGLFSQPRNVPFGVKPCQPKVKLIEQPMANLNIHDSNLVLSLGVSRNGIGGSWWIVVISLEVVVMFWFL